MTENVDIADLRRGDIVTAAFDPRCGEQWSPQTLFPMMIITIPRLNEIDGAYMIFKGLCPDGKIKKTSWTSGRIFKAIKR